MPKNVPISPVVRDILSKDLSLSADEVIKLAKARGVTASEASIRSLSHNIKSDLKKAQRAKPAPAAARTSGPAAKAAAPNPASAAPQVAPNLTPVFANVNLVNKVVDVAGGVDNARQVAEAVRACGSVEAFLQHLELVAGIRGSG